MKKNTKNFFLNIPENAESAKICKKPMYRVNTIEFD